MSLKQKIQEETKEAMKARNAAKLLVLRGLSAAFTNEAISKKKSELTDDEAIAVVKRAVKQRKDSIEQFTKGGRDDLAKNEASELKILETYLPASVGKDEILKVALVKKTEMGITDKSKAGQLTGAVMKELKGKANGADVKEVVESLLP